MEEQQQIQLGDPKGWHVVTRHEPTVELLRNNGIKGEVHEHIDLNRLDEMFKPGDTVVGVLPIHIIAELNKRDINFLSFEIDVPKNLRNVTLSQEVIKNACHPRLTHYTAEEAENAQAPNDIQVAGQFSPRATAEWLGSKGYNVLNEPTTSHTDIRTGDFRTGPEDSVAGELLARDVATLNAQGAKYFQIAMPDLPLENRGRHISVEKMDEAGAELRSYDVSRGRTLDISGNKEVEVDEISAVRKYQPKSLEELFETPQNQALGAAEEKCHKAYKKVKKTNEHIAQDGGLQEMQKLSEDLIVDAIYENASAGAAKEKVAHLVLGLPGSGKSSVIAKHLMETDQAFELDSDLIKDQLPGYMDGYGAGAVHEQSDALMKRVMQTALDDGVSFVHPVIGKTMEGLDKKIDQFREAGYEVYVHNVQVPREISVHRAVARYNETGRYVDPGYIMSIDPEKIEGNFDRLTQDTRITGYSEWDNHVELGANPHLLRAHNVTGVPEKEGTKRDGNPELTGNESTMDVNAKQLKQERRVT